MAIVSRGAGRRQRLVLLLSALILAACDIAACPAGYALQAKAAAVQSSQTPVASQNSGLPLNFERHTGDLDEMVKRGSIRALVMYSRTGFFYVNGRPEGIYYEALRDFETFLNQKLHTRQHVQVLFIPVRPDQMETALTQGVGDLAAASIVVTPERAEQVTFSIPIETNVNQIVVGGKNFGPVNSVEDLSGKKIFVNPLTTYGPNLEKINSRLRSQGKPPILIQPTDKNLMDEDLLEMVNAGLLSATVTGLPRALLWSQVLTDVTPYPKVIVGNEADVAWAMRKNNPQLAEIVNAFVKPRAVGTSYGNTMVRKYLENAQALKNATSESEMKKFDQTVGFFQKYATQYQFDYLMVVAQGYQESMLEQSARSPGGAIGIMQVKPGTAAAPPISIPDITTAENNIHAGVKVLRSIADQYFSDPKIDRVNRLLFTFAAYNAGPNRIADLRKRAAAQGLDPNQWFGNVELLVAQSVGPVTLQYVSNIYKYYVAYKLVVEQGESLQ